jgi:hypothetical protein
VILVYEASTMQLTIFVQPAQLITAKPVTLVGYYVSPYDLHYLGIDYTAAMMVHIRMATKTSARVEPTLRH